MGFQAWLEVMMAIGHASFVGTTALKNLKDAPTIACASTRLPESSPQGGHSHTDQLEGHYPYHLDQLHSTEWKVSSGPFSFSFYLVLSCTRSYSMMNHIYRKLIQMKRIVTKLPAFK
jgi:hypothetical protein